MNIHINANAFMPGPRAGKLNIYYWKEMGWEKRNMIRIHIIQCRTFVVIQLLSSINCLQLQGLQQAGLLHPSPSPGVCSDSCPLSWWCYLTISSSAACFSSCLQSFAASGSFPVSQLLASGGQSIGSFRFCNSPSNEWIFSIDFL